MKDIFRTYFTDISIRNSLPKFIKSGLAVVATLLLTAIITDKVTGGAVNEALSSNAIYVNATQLFREKELPIYCVKTDKKQIALTFDGAWGDGGYGHRKNRERPCVLGLSPFSYIHFYPHTQMMSVSILKF